MKIWHRKCKIPSEADLNGRSGVSRRHCRDTISERGSLSQAASRSSSPSKHVSRCQSFAERTPAQPLPLPGLHLERVERTDSGVSVPTKPRSEKSAKSFVPLRRPACICSKPNRAETDGASVSGGSSSDSDDPADSRQRSPQATDCDTGASTTACSPSRLFFLFRNP